ncbi:hypothetical protein [Micromonospora sp. WMMD980]|uniref:hypothetical protein n=1 Tax=Micromonospora sp. WMMD980 TaxID=3016088 RepID=UPI002417C17B|nr:hypothetical protein [Micromonospora sp. WMMD980]MDG4801694.1 hypothetical protein [Micromonospora sp. WMMD980]
MPVPSGAASGGAPLPVRASAPAPEKVTAASGPPLTVESTRTVYVVGLAALALPAGWWVLRRRQSRETPSAAVYEEAYELGRADERATVEQPAAKVLRLPRHRA